MFQSASIHKECRSGPRFQGTRFQGTRRLGAATLLIACFCAWAPADDLVLKSVKPAPTRAAVLKYGLTRADADWIEKTIPGVLHVIRFRAMPQTFRYGGLQLSGRMCGTEAQTLEYDGHQLQRGRYLTDNDLRQKHNVAVIGQDIAERLFAKTDPIGKNLRAGGHLFLVVGVARWQGDDAQNSIHIPLSTMRVRLGDLVVHRKAGSFSAEQYELSAIRIVPKSDVDFSKQRRMIETRLQASRK